MNPEGPVLAASGIRFRYRTAHSPVVLDGLSLELHAGETLAIRGPSGSGKSTLLYVLSGLVGPYEGEVRIGGLRISELTESERAQLRSRSIGFIFQQFYLLPKATVLENILLPKLYSNTQESSSAVEARARELAIRFGLGSVLSSFPNHLSGGQQQRVAIARALLNRPRILIADEPTGSLDSKNSTLILDTLTELAAEGHAVLIVTHDREVADRCDRQIEFRDGKIVGDLPLKKLEPILGKHLQPHPPYRAQTAFKRTVPLALSNLRQNKGRSALTMLGIVIGIASILAMVTIGGFTRRKILDSYADLGVNTLTLHAFPNWELKATDKVPAVFAFLDWEKDVTPLRRLFPEITAVTPLLVSWNSRASFAGRAVESEVRVTGVSASGRSILNREISLGRDISEMHVRMRAPVCLLGFEIHERLFPNQSALGQIVQVSQEASTFGCQVIGVLKSQTSNKDWNRPNMQILIPHTYFDAVFDFWSSRKDQAIFKIAEGRDIDATGRAIKNYFKRRYGSSGKFIIGTDSLLIAQMRKFLGLFQWLLAMVALVSVAVGGIGITNMMLVSLKERLKEIGIRKAYGATDEDIRNQTLVESLCLCGLAGAIGTVLGFAVYEGAIYGATQLLPKMSFEWVFDPLALSLALVSTLLTGIMAGLVPAIQASRLDVMEALRGE